MTETKIQEEASPVKRRGQKRSKALDEAILKATLEVLAENGYAGFTINKLIDRAGVSSATIYRRWDTTQSLIIAALRSLAPEPVTIDTGSFAGDMDALVKYLGNALKPPDLGSIHASGVRVDAQLRKVVLDTFVTPRKKVLAEILRRAHSRGDLETLPSIDDCWSFVSGPIYHRTHIRREDFTAEFCFSLTTLLTAGLGAIAMR